MFDWLRRILGVRSTTEVHRENPLLRKAVKKSAIFLRDSPLRSLIGDADCESLARDYYLELNRVCNARDPKETCREKFATTMLRFALYQVLILEPPPSEDKSGMLGLPGITGELAEYARSLSLKSIALRSDLYDVAGYDGKQDLASVIRVEYWKCYWLLESLNEIRKQLSDTTSPDDWFVPFMHAVCASQENLYRIDLELPSAFSEIHANTAPIAYSIFTDIVISGAADPLGEWLDYHAGTSLSPPGTKAQLQSMTAA